MPASPPAPAGRRGAPDHPFFEREPHGYHMPQVDEYIRTMLAKVRELERQLAATAGHDAAAAVQSPQARQAIDELMQLALDEILGRKAAAAAEADQLLTAAKTEAAGLLADARKDSEGMVAGAREQSGTLLNDARAQAKAMTDEAAAKAAAVGEAAERRLGALISTHEQTMARIGEIAGVTTRLVGLETERGSLRDEVERATGMASVSAAAPAQLTATAE